MQKLLTVKNLSNFPSTPLQLFFMLNYALAISAMQTVDDKKCTFQSPHLANFYSMTKKQERK